MIYLWLGVQGLLTNYAIKGRVQRYSLICKQIPAVRLSRIVHRITLPVDKLDAEVH
jgi:hypothetical protein